MTAERFFQLTGNHPIQDDLERCNCPLAGILGHSSCGLCPHGWPNFMVCYSCHPEWLKLEQVLT
jgi:hypothetical protein